MKPNDTPGPEREFCPLSERVDGKKHSWKFDGDDPYIICVYCDEMRDALTDVVIRPGKGVRSMTISEAAKNGIKYLRLPHWAMPDDYVELYIVDGRSGPWMYLHSRMNEVVGNPDPMTIPTIFDTDNRYVEYKLPETLPSVPASESGRVAVPNPNQKENTQ